MTIYIPAPPPVAAYDPAKSGCTYIGCTTQDTATVDGHYGRRCAQHPPTFDPNRAVALMAGGWPGTALAYVRGWE